MYEVVVYFAGEKASRTGRAAAVEAVVARGCASHWEAGVALDAYYSALRGARPEGHAYFKVVGGKRRKVASLFQRHGALGYMERDTVCDSRCAKCKEWKARLALRYPEVLPGYREARFIEEVGSAWWEEREAAVAHLPTL